MARRDVTLATSSARRYAPAMADSQPLSPQGKRTSFWTPEMQDTCVARIAPEDEHLRAIVRDAAAKGFPAIAISAADGQVLQFLVRSCRARHAVEIGTLAGYSGLWIARSLVAGGKLDSFELDPVRAAFAREHIAAAKPPVQVTVHEGPALANLGRIEGEVDFVFIDADKGNYPNYVAWAMGKVRIGGVIALDNAFAWGGLVDPAKLGDRAPEAVAMREAIDRLVRDGRFTTAMIPTNEGLAVAVRNA
jgi:caffeoyl-CoA O-methyltransferase